MSAASGGVGEEPCGDDEVFSVVGTVAKPAKRVARSVSFVGVDEGPEAESRASHSRVAVGMEESILHNEFERCEYDFRVFVVFVTVSLFRVDF